MKFLSKLWLSIIIGSFVASGFMYAHAYAFDKVLRIPLRVHLGKSGRSVNEWVPMLEEINHIWLSQTGICYEMEVVFHDRTLDEGLDLWFVSGDHGIYNGMFRDDHDIWIKDTPDLRPATLPARYPAARTAAHELGHGLGLGHNSSSDDNLMQSQTFGWQLDKDELGIARTYAEHMAYQDKSKMRCGPPRINR